MKIFMVIDEDNVDDDDGDSGGMVMMTGDV